MTLTETPEYLQTYKFVFSVTLLRRLGIMGFFVRGEVEVF